MKEKLGWNLLLLLPMHVHVPNNEGPGQALCFLIEEIYASCQRNCNLHGKIFSFYFINVDYKKGKKATIL